MKKLNKELLERNIGKIAQFDLVENNVFGSAYLVRQDGEKVCEKYFGFTGMEDKKKVDSDTIYRLASMTKPVTAMAILILVDRKLISLSDVVKKYFPQFENIHVVPEHGIDMGKTKTDVTIMHLLTHSSGIGSVKPINMTAKDKATIENTINYFVSEGLDFEPFTKQVYSAFGAFDVLSGIIEKVTERDFEEFLQREIFAPCGMKDTTFIPTENQCKRIITMHDKVDGKNQVGKTTDGCVFEDFPYYHKLGGAGLASTLTDYSKFAEMLLHKGKINGKQIVSEETFSLMAVPYINPNALPANERWGLGVRVITSEEYECLPVGTFGWSGAYGTHFWVDPENEITAVFMKNSRFDGGASNKSAHRFEKAVYDALEN